jgi:hypothetical protein
LYPGHFIRRQFTQQVTDQDLIVNMVELLFQGIIYLIRWR